MRNIITIIKKEFKRFFTDPRMLMSLLLPGILIFLIYSLMGDFMGDSFAVEDDYTYTAVVVNYDENLDDYFSYLNEGNFDITFIDNPDENYKQMITDEELDLYVIYPNNFYNESLNYDPSIHGNNNSPIVEIYFNSTSVESSNLYSIYQMGLSNFQESIAEKFRVNYDIDADLASEESATIMIITMLVPFLLITFLFTGAMSISIESIAGEKERGTIATLLATPVKRNEIAFGKIISLSVVSLVGAASSFIGLMLSIPKLMGGLDLDLSIYGIKEYALLLLVIITLTLLYVVLISIVSAFSKSIKEASGFASALMIVNMLAGISSFIGSSNTSRVAYFIPIYNSVQAISSILSLEVNSINLLITAAVNLGLVGIGVFILTLMFNSEKVMFNK